MGKITLKDVTVTVDVQFERDLHQKFDFEGESLDDLKATLNQFGEDVANEFGTTKDKVKMKGANFSKNNFVVF